MKKPDAPLLAKQAKKNKAHAKTLKTLTLALLALMLVALVALPATASAHPLGNFTVNRYSRLEIGAAGVRLFYVLDMAEIPTLQEKDGLIDTNNDKTISETERQVYLDRKVAELQNNLKLSVSGSPVTLRPLSKELIFPKGQGDLDTIRLTVRFETDALPSNSASLDYRDENYRDRIGWSEIVVRNATGVALEKSSVSATDQSQELRRYPEDMLASPLAVTSAQVSFRLDPGVKVEESQGSSNGAVVKSDDPFAALVTGKDLTWGVILFSFGVAFVLGMFHALSPGHGKTIVGAYLVGSRGTALHAVFLGLTVTVTHTIGVFTLGLVTLFAAQFVVPEKLYPWLSFISGLLVVIMGLALLRSRLRFASARAGVSQDHTNDHHDHSQDHDHTHALVTTQERELVLAGNEPNLSVTGESGRPLNVAGAYVLTQDAPYAHTQSSDHEHEHDHNPEAHSHSHADDHDHDHTHSHPGDHHDHDHEHNDADHVHAHPASGHQPAALMHSHDGGKSHSHLPPGMDGKDITWRRLLVFGISAGLLPCPSALVVMLSSIALGRTALGLILVVFFSLGLAGTLTLLGILLVYARHLLGRFKVGSGRFGRVLRFVPAVSALAITVLGIAISYEALTRTGLFNR